VRIASLAEVKAKLSGYLDEAARSGPVVITRNGRAVAVLLAPIDEDDLERLLLSRSPRFRSLLSKSRASIEAGRGIPHEEFWDSAAKAADRRPRESGGRRRVGPAGAQSKPRRSPGKAGES
jgi:prevent-host-death family protein